MDLLDKKIIYHAIQLHESQYFDDEIIHQDIIEELQEIRLSQKGEMLNTDEIVNKITDLQTRAKIKRGMLLKVGNTLIPNLESLSMWKGYSKIDY